MKKILKTSQSQAFFILVQPSPRNLLARYIVLIVMLVALFGSPTYVIPARAASIIVNTDQEIEADNSLCSLYEAVIAANTDSAYKGCPAGSGADVITFADDYTITLLVTELQILSPITITGRGITNTIIQASDCNPITTPGGCSPAYNRVFYIINNDVTINDLTIQHGNCDSGCIGVNNIGGGIYNAGGNLTINNVLLNANKADYGGGLYTSGSFNTVALNNVTITGNDASNGDGRGGGAHLSANTTFANVTITNNTAKYGGGIYFYQSYTYNMLQTTMIGNSASMAGGGIYNNSAAPNITNSTISGNDANYMLGGGGIYNDGGSPVLTNVTISGNSAQNSYGGGILNTNNSDPVLTNVTFSNNLAGTNGGGGMLNTNGSNPTLYNTLIANSAGGGDCVNNSTALSPSNNNLIEDASNACGLTNGANGNIVGQDPNLGALLNNGGNSLTHALQVGSPAIDAGTNTGCPATDQRGVARPVGLICDIGAYEAPITLPAGWVGSVSVTSDKDLVSVGRPHIGAEVASYDGFSSGSTTAFVPMLFKDAFGGSYDAALYIQNVSGSSASVTIQYYDSSGVLNCTKADTIAPLASKGYWLPAATCDTGSLPTGWVGGVKVTSNHPIVAVGRPHIGAEVMTYNGFSSGSTSAFIPMLFKGAFGGSYNAAFYVQNVSGSSANVTLEYFDNTGTLNCTKSDTIASLASKGYWLPAATCDTGSLPAGWVGGVRVSSSQPVVTVGRPHIDTQITTYDGFSAGANSAYVPMLFKGAFGGSYNAAFYLQNVSNSSASVTIKYYDNAGTLNCTKADTIAPLASKGYWVPAATCDTGSLPAGWVGGVEVTSDQPIVSVGRPHIDAQVTTYNGFTAGATDVFLPMLFKDAFGGSYDSAFYLQNTEATAANVTIQFYDATGALTCSRSDTIQPRATLGFWVPSATCFP